MHCYNIVELYMDCYDIQNLSSNLALAALLKIEPFGEKGIVDKTSDTEATRGLEPREKVTSKDNQCDKRLVGSAEVFAKRKEGKVPIVSNQQAMQTAWAWLASSTVQPG
jgi:hypothetical protein